MSLKRIPNLFFLVIFTLVGVLSNGQAVSYDLSFLPDSVKKDASVITQYDLQRLVVEDLEKATYSRKHIYSVVNEEGRRSLLVALYSTKYINLDEMDLKVFDKTGKQTARFKKKDMMMQATGEGLIDEGAYYYVDVPAPSYPVTVEIEYVQKFKGTLKLPGYEILNPGEAIVESLFEAVIPSGLVLRYRAKNIDIKPVIKDLGKAKSYLWTTRNLPPFEYEEGAVNQIDRYPSVDLVLNNFSHYGYPGELSSWQSFGQWLSKLYVGLDELPQDRVNFFKDLVKGSNSDREKAQIIYKYLQDNFRYVSIQLGIGGVKPFSATFTDQKKYGDCKGLSNYMKAALAAVGVRSHIAIINSEYNSLPADPAFPINNFNHAILCIPQPEDSIWLECTSNIAEFGVLGTNTENRNALLVTENGGILVPTPKSTAEANSFLIHNKIELSADASGMIESSLRSTGAYKEGIDYILKEKRDDQKESIVFRLGFKQPDDFLMAKEKEKVNLKLQFEKIPEFTAGNKMFLAPHPYKLWTRVMPKNENRKLDYYFSDPFVHLDTTQIKLPDGFMVDALPKPREFSNAYATYRSNYWFDEANKTIYSVVELKLLQHRIPAVDFKLVKQFFEEVLKEEKQRIVVKKS